MIKKILLLVIVYIFIYNPVFSILPNSDSLSFFFPLVLLIFTKRYSNGINKYTNIIYIWGLICVYILIKTLGGGDITYLYGWIGYFIESILLAYILAKIIVRSDINIISLLLKTGSIASIISCLCLFFTPFDQFIREIQIVYSNVNTQVVFRAFGLAQSLNFEFGVTQGLILGLGLFNIKDNKWFIPIIPFVILSILINARTGFLVVILAAIFAMAYYKKYKYMIYTFLALIVFLSSFQLLQHLIPAETYQWIEEFFFELEDAILGTNKATFNTSQTLVEMLILPDDFLSWVFGTGYNVFRVKYGAHSDVGYINQLYYGGIVYLGMIIWITYVALKKGMRFMPKVFFYFVIISLLVINFKGGAFGANNGFIKLLSLLSFVYFMVYKNKISIKP